MFDVYQTFKNNFREIPISMIHPNPEQPRKRFRDRELAELSENIRQIGLIHPITVRFEQNKYVLISGERRLRAAKLAGIYSLPCIVMDISDEDALLISLSENIQRKDLNYFEQAQAIENLMTSTGMSQEKIARKLGKTQSTIANKLRLLKIPPYIQRFILDSHLRERHARALLRLGDDKMMYKACEAAAKAKMNVGQLEAYIDKLLAKKERTKKPFRKGFCKDLRLYINTLNHTVDIMKNSGINTLLEKVEDETKIIYRIVINK